jgi:hypothetical protein
MVFSSVYEMTNPLTTVRKQHFWDWFSGDSLNARWTVRHLSGTGTWGMVDEVDGGFSLISGASAANNRSRIDFNNIRQYSETGSSCITIAKREATSNALLEVGFGGAITTVPTSRAIARDQSNQTYKALLTDNTGGSNQTFSTVPIDTAWTNYKIDCKAATVDLNINGSLAVTNSAYLPNSPQMPYFEARNITTAGATEMRIRYMECYNT